MFQLQWFSSKKIMVGVSLSSVSEPLSVHAVFPSESDDRDPPAGNDVGNSKPASSTSITRRFQPIISNRPDRFAGPLADDCRELINSYVLAERKGLLVRKGKSLSSVVSQEQRRTLGRANAGLRRLRRLFAQQARLWGLANTSEYSSTRRRTAALEDKKYTYTGQFVGRLLRGGNIKVKDRVGVQDEVVFVDVRPVTNACLAWSGAAQRGEDYHDFDVGMSW